MVIGAVRHNNSWEYGMPASNKINNAASGTKAWKTNLTGNYNDQKFLISIRLVLILQV